MTKKQLKKGKIKEYIKDQIWKFIYKCLAHRVTIDFEYLGDKGTRQVHSTSIQLKPKQDKIIINWDTKEVDVIWK